MVKYMKKNMLKIIIGLVIVLLVCIVSMYLIDCTRMKNGDTVLFSTWGQKYAPPVNQNNDIIKDIVDNTEYSFCGTITQVEENLFFVEPDDGEEIRKSSNLIMVGKLKLDTNVKYEVGERIRIFYDGTVMETYPAQIKAIKYESISESDFKILFENNQTPDKIYSILDKSETNKYDYNIYAYDGIVTIRINGNNYSLKEALLENKIAMEEILKKASEDFPNSPSYDDGGSVEYHYENYTIIKLNTLDGNRDVYFGPKNMTIHNIKN